MARNISVGIDIGTYHTKVVVAELVEGKGKRYPKVIGTGTAPSSGMRHGYIIHAPDAKRSLRKALRAAEQSSGIAIKRAHLAIGGVSLDAIMSKGSVIVSRGDSEITEIDIENAIEASERAIPEERRINKKVLHRIPLSYAIDGKEVLGRAVGLKGMKVEVVSLFVTCLEQHLNDLIQVVEDSGIEVEDVIAGPVAASIVTLSKTQKIAGVVLANIGSETTSIIVYENGIPISLEVFSVGSTDITNDIALGLKIPLEEAEQIKRGGITSSHISKKKLDEIIVARLEKIFEQIEEHLRAIGKNGLLPAGIIITGGGSGALGIEELAKGSLKLPSSIGDISMAGENRLSAGDSAWSIAYGLCVLGLLGDGGSTGISVDGAKNTLVTWVKRFLP